MDATPLSSSLNSLSSDGMSLLYQLTKDNSDRLSDTLNLLLNVGMFVLAILTIVFVILGLLVWNHINQAREARDVLKDVIRMKDDVEISAKQAEGAARYAMRTEAGLRVPEVEISKDGLSKEDLFKKAYQHRSFGENLYQISGANEVFAEDEQGYFHWIPDPETLIRMGYTWSDIKQFPNAIIKRIPRGENIPSVLNS